MKSLFFNTIQEISSRENRTRERPQGSSLRDSLHSMKANPPKNKAGAALIHTGMDVPLMTASHWKMMRRKCPRAIRARMIMESAVKGFGVRMAASPVGLKKSGRCPY
jgi:hypothetical protein